MVMSMVSVPTYESLYKGEQRSLRNIKYFIKKYFFYQLQGL